MVTRALILLCICIVQIAFWPALAADCPPCEGKKIRVLLGSPAGSQIDVGARALASALSNQLGLGVSVENQVGANGGIAANTARNAPINGEVLFLANASSSLTADLVLSNVRPASDGLKAISVIGAFPLALVVSTSSSAKSMSDLITAGKGASGKITYGAPTASIYHLASELLGQRSSTGFSLVPYKSVGTAATDLFAGQLGFMFMPLAQAIEYHRQGKLRVLATGGKLRSRALPEIATIEKLGMKGFEAVEKWIVYLPSGASEDTARQWNAQLSRAVRSAEFLGAVRESGFESVEGTVSEIAASLLVDRERWASVIRQARVRAD